MRLLDGLSSLFVNTFGITRPTEETRRRAGYFIAGMLLLVAVLLCGAAALVYHTL